MQNLNDRFKNIITDLEQKDIGFIKRYISVFGGTAAVLYIKELTNKNNLSDQIIRPLIKSKDDPKLCPGDIGNYIFVNELKVLSDDSVIADELLEGMTIILFSNRREYVVIDLKEFEKRQIPTPEAMYSMRGPKDCFIEDLQTNISLVRSRIKDINLKIDVIKVGRRTKTSVAVMYLKDVANDNSVSEVIKRISNIDTDGIIESGELQSFLLNKKTNLFPQTGLIERSDTAGGALLEGKILILVDGASWALAAPRTFFEFLWTCDDRYDNKYLTVFLRILRIVALFLSFTVSALYVALVSFHSDVMPTSYIIAIAVSRARVPFNALIEVLLIEFIVELLHESLIRVPKKIGTAIGIVGAIIIGDAAVSAGIFSPLLLIVISISLISTFIPEDYTLMNTFRILKFLLILATGMFGFFGFTVVLTFVLAQLVSINTFGVPYFAPYAPFYKRDFFMSLFYDKSISHRRADFLRTKDNTIGKGNPNQK